MRGLQPALPASAARRAQLDADARRARPRAEARDVPALRDDGGFAARRRTTSGPQKAEHRADWVPDDIKPKIEDENGGYEKKADILYFAGCTASFVEKDIAEASIRLLTDSGYDVGYMGPDEACCGIPMKVAGKWDLFEEIFEHNVAEATQARCQARS